MTDGPAPTDGTPPSETEPKTDIQPEPAAPGRIGLFTKITNPSGNVVERTRAWTGMWVVAAGDVTIVLAAIWGVIKISGSGTSGSTIVAILTSAFTAIGTMTTAYFGIRSTANTAQRLAQQGTGTPTQARTPQ